MALSMKERYARLDISKLPEEVKLRFNSIKEKTDNFEDQDVLDIWQKPFDTLYEIVEAKHPDAIKTGGVLKKEKPTKVKVAKPKKIGKVTDTDMLTPEAKEEYHSKLKEIHEKVEKERMKSMRKKLSADDIEFIEDQLTNDEESTDEEMISHIAKETGIPETQAAKWVKLREKYMRALIEAQKPENIESYAGMTARTFKYSERTANKKAARKEKNTVKTRDGYEIDRKDPKNKGKKFFDENGKEWTCVRYSKELDECILKDDEGKEISCCLKDMYVNNPVKKREKGNMVDECRETLKEAGYTIKEHKTGTKKIKRKAPRPEKEIIKERVGDAFTPIVKDLKVSEDKEKENKEMIDLLEDIQKSFTKFMNRISNLADDNKVDALKKIQKLLKELLDE
jgi:hypothetical protein